MSPPLTINLWIKMWPWIFILARSFSPKFDSHSNVSTAAVLQPSAAGMKAVRGTYLKEIINGMCPTIWSDLTTQ